MATRFYLPPTGNSDVQPATTGWTNSASSIIRRMQPTPTRTRITIASTTISVNNSSSTATTLFARFVSPALMAQNIAGTVTAHCRASIASTTGATCQTRIKVIVVDRAGTIVATLLDITSGAVNLTTTLSNKIMVSAASLTSYNCADGDRIVVEVGIGRSAGTTARNGTLSFGDSSATDLTSNGETTANNPWVEFSQDFIFNKGINF